MKRSTKRKMRILWCIVAPIAVVVAVYYSLTNTFENPLIPWGIMLGTCVALNVPMLLAVIIDDCDNRIATFVVAILLSPIWLLWNWFVTVKSLLKGRSGVDWLKSDTNSGRRNSGSNGTAKVADDRKSDNWSIFSAMERAISGVCSNDSNYPSGSYMRFDSKKVEYLVTRLFGIKIYGTVTYQITNTEMYDYQYKDDINDALNAATNKLIAAAERAVENVREKYKGYDDDWNIEVSLQGKVKV